MSSHSQNSGDQEADSTSCQHASLESSRCSGAVLHEQSCSNSPVFDIVAMDALKMLSTHLGNLLKINGDVPPTSLISPTSSLSEPFGGVRKEDTPSKVVELHWSSAKNSLESTTLLGTAQQDVLVKRFYSKKAPPISPEDYLLRLHKYCPMSTAVYLATSLYITRMVMVEKIVPVTPRNVHRLVLAGLRVAMKALEDLSYPHSRFARVGGVTARELTRLEVTFCFLMDFELRVDIHMLMGQAHYCRTIMQRTMALDIQKLGEGCSDSVLITSASTPKEVPAGAPENP
jgi:hypothetical protein